MMVFNVHITVKTERAVAVGSSALLGGDIIHQSLDLFWWNLILIIVFFSRNLPISVYVEY
jgi:hypothetical protein